MILTTVNHLVTTVNHFVNDCPNLDFLPAFLLHRSSLEVRVQLFHLGLMISTLEIALANILRNVLVLFGCGGCPSMQQSGRSLSLVFDVPSLRPPFIPFSLSPFHLESILLETKDLLFVLLGFPRHACLRDRSPKSSELFGNSRIPKFADQNHIRSSYCFLPRFTLESISYSLTRQRALVFTFREN